MVKYQLHAGDKLVSDSTNEKLVYVNVKLVLCIYGVD